MKAMGTLQLKSAGHRTDPKASPRKTCHSPSKSVEAVTEMGTWGGDNGNILPQGSVVSVSSCDVHSAFLCSLKHCFLTPKWLFFKPYKRRAKTPPDVLYETPKYVGNS